MQDGGADPSRQMDSDPTGQPETYECHICGLTFDFWLIFDIHLSSHGTGSEHDKQEERPGPSRQMASGSTGDNMQGESVGSSRLRNSDPTEQPDNVGKKSVTTEEQKYELKRKQRNLERESFKKMKQELKRKREKLRSDISDADSKDDKQEERPGPSRQMASGSTRDNIFISTPHPKNIQRLSREYPENIQSSSASSLNVFGIRALLRTPDESVGSSRQMDSDPTEQPDNVSKESLKKKKQEYDLLSRKRMKEYPENIQSSSASSLSVFGIRALLRTPDEDDGPSIQMASSSTGDNMQSESVGSSRQRDSDPTKQPDKYVCNLWLRLFCSLDVLYNHLKVHMNYLYNHCDL
ncbi:uncharacterized protein LOC114941526 [Nylanderia fulva]|uniref:uncharacterized protein LOC114941526 n=1 Tax=Nylanderia fulva TaxID=613905 RepID=UPI0010FB63E0|nr:uncharacterized protein LOC114941526 [Nylanderia fulva]